MENDFIFLLVENKTKNEIETRAKKERLGLNDFCLSQILKRPIRSKELLKN